MTKKPPLPLHKLDALKAAVSGKMLTTDQIEALEACIKDYRFIFRLGNGFKLTHPDRDHLNELLQLVYEDVPFMAGERKKKAIRLLNAAGMKGYQPERFWPRSRFDDEAPLEVDAEEVTEALEG